MVIKRTITITTAFLLVLAVSAQIIKPKAVNMLDFDEQEEEASAVYLLNDGHTEVRYDRTAATWIASTERIYRIKILKEDALDLGNVKISLYQAGKMNSERQTVDVLSASTYNFDPEKGVIEKSDISKKDIYREDLTESLKEVSFTLPNVKVNSVLEISYVKHSPFIHQLEDWYFQRDFPVKQSRFAVTIPAFFIYVFQLQGHLETKTSNMGLDDEQKTYGRYRYQDLKAHWQMEDIPAFQKEPFMTTREDYISKLVFQLQTYRTPEIEKDYLRTWEDVTKDLQDSRKFKLYYEGKKDFKAFTLSQAPDPLERAKEIYESFKKSFTWNKKFSVYPDVGFRKMMEARTGNSSAMGLTLFQSLEQAGLDARPVLFSPRFNGQVNYNYPFRDRLVATVVRLRIYGETYLLDPLSNMPFGYLNREFLNGKGLVLGNQVEWVDLTKVAKEQKTSQVRLSVSGDSIRGDIEVKMKDYGMISAGSELEELFKSDWEITDMKITEDELTSRTVTASIDKEIEDDLILIPFSFDQVILAENLLKSEERLYPVDFYYSKKYSYQLKIELSDEYAFESLPESKVIRLPDRLMDMTIGVSQLGSVANITLLFWTRTNSFQARHYPKVKEAYEFMDKLGNEVIVVKKKT